MFNKISILLMAFAGTAFSAPTDALLISKPSGNAYYLYEDGHTKKNGIARAWILFNMDDDDVISDEMRASLAAWANPTGERPSVRSTLSLNEADCVEVKIRTLDTKYYSEKDGINPVVMPHGTPAPPEWSYPAPKTVGYAILNAVCQEPSKKRKK